MVIHDRVVSHHTFDGMITQGFVCPVHLKGVQQWGQNTVGWVWQWVWSVYGRRGHVQREGLGEVESSRMHNRMAEAKEKD